jgi:probable F420-dependent oxidoreductase
VAVVDVGFALPQFDFSVPGEAPLRWETVEAWARAAEERGFDSVWLADHVFLEVEKYQGPPGRFDGFDPLVALAALARATTTVRLGTLVLCAQLRPPTVLSKMLATLDRLSGGRVIVGIGAGWYAPEFEAAGVAFLRPGARVEQLDEAIQILRGMWATADPSADTASFSFGGRHYRATDARCRPGPATPNGPPIWVGGRGDRVMEVAARRADGFNHGGWNAKAGPRRLSHFHELCERVGRDPATITLSVNHTVEDVARLPDELAAFAEQGVATVVVGLGELPFSVTTFDALDQVASAIPVGGRCSD